MVALPVAPSMSQVFEFSQHFLYYESIFFDNSAIFTNSFFALPLAA